MRGLSYALLVFVCRKSDDREDQTAALDILHALFIDGSRTADYQTTRGIIERNGNADDLMTFMYGQNLPIDDSETVVLAAELLREPPRVGCLTISNALQWRLHYSRAIDRADRVSGMLRVV